MKPLSGRDRSAIALVLAALCLSAPIVSWRALRDARRDAESALSEYETAAAQARRLGALRAAAAVVGDRWRPEPDLVARVSASLHAAGVDPGSLTRLSTSNPRRDHDSAHMRQSATLTVEGVTPADAARFLAEWRAAEPQWSVRSLRLQRQAQRRGDAGDPGWTALLTIETLYLEEPSGVEPDREGT